MKTEFDYIIVGSGAAGSTLAYRLSQQSGASVLVLEHGPGDRNPLHRVPKGFFFTLKGDRYTYHYATEPIAGTSSKEIWTRGKVVGGSTTINGMMYNRGAKPDFDALEAHTGSAAWGWDRFLAAYRAMEHHALGASASRGGDGLLGISATGETGELADRIFAAGEKQGWRRVEDLNVDDDERIGYTASSVRNGRRSSAASAFLRPALRSGAVTLHTHTRVKRILLNGTRAVGVLAQRRGADVTFHARREVILAAGAVETPLLLERSGIGRPDVLAKAGIDTVVEAGNVGERVIEQHFPATVQVRFNRRLGATEHLNSLFKQGIRGAGYLLNRSGPIATAGYDFTFFCKSDPSLDRPDLVGSLTPFAIDPTAASMKLADHSGALIGMYQIRPETMSSIHLAGSDPALPPVISPHYFETETDVHASSAVLAKVRELIASEPLAEVVEGEDFPTLAVSSDPEPAMEHARAYGTTVYHAVGSCAMGLREDDVVDAQLRVRGVQGLRVADASVLPFQVSANTGAPVMALGWIAGDVIAAAE